MRGIILLFSVLTMLSTWILVEADNGKSTGEYLISILDAVKEKPNLDGEEKAVIEARFGPPTDIKNFLSPRGKKKQIYIYKPLDVGNEKIMITFVKDKVVAADYRDR